MSYVNRKFCHYIIPWIIDVCCRQPYHEDFCIETKNFHLACDTLTSWRMTLRYRNRRDRKSKMRFELKRMPCETGLRNLTKGDFRLTLQEGPTEKEVACSPFSLAPNSVIRIDIPVKDPLPSTLIELKVQIVFSFVGVSECIPECSDPYVKQLSEDMKSLFKGHGYNGYDIKVRCSTWITLFLHKGILINRIRKEDLKQEIRENDTLFLGHSRTIDAWSKVLCFLYTANMGYCSASPSIDTYNAASYFGVEPMLTYFEPDYLKLYTRTECEDLALVWIIENFQSRPEQRLVSPLITGELGNGIMRLAKTKRGNVVIDCQIKLEAEKYVCMELLLKTRKAEVVEKTHRRPIAGETIRTSTKIPHREFAEVLKGESIIFKLMVRMYCVEGEMEGNPRLRCPSFGESRIVCKPYCNQRNYVQLSDDLMSLYRSSRYFSIDISSPIALYNNQDDDYMFKFRNEKFAKAIFAASSDHRGMFGSDVLRALVQFIYCAKLGDTVGTVDSFRLIKIADRSEFHSLRDALIDNLKKLLSNENANEIYSLAESCNMPDFMAYMRSREDLLNLRKPT